MVFQCLVVGGQRFNPPFPSGLLIKLSSGPMQSTCTGHFCLFGEVLQHALLCLDFNVWLTLLSHALPHYTLGRCLLSVVCGYMPLWWLSQYHDMVDAISHPTQWWFFTLQAFPVYYIIVRGVLNALQFWSEWILSLLLLPRCRAEPAPFFCGYTSSWFVPPRR
jgi:hypothetical protein